MLLLVGLGNPGAQYAGNRHNIGFMALDAIHRRLGGTPWRARFSAQAGEAGIGADKAILLKPATFMNESGRAVSEAMRFYRIALENVFVFHDELDLAPAKMRLKRGGGNAGHNGLRSISAHCANGYPRIRLGIGHPGDKALVHNYVLNDFARAERPWVEDLCAACAENIGVLPTGDDALFQTKVHLFMEARGHVPAPPPKAPKPAADDNKTGQIGEPR